MSRSKTTLSVLRGVSGEWRRPTMWTGSLSSRLRIVATTGLNRSTKPHISGTPRRSAQATRALLVSRSGVTGFSTRIGLPSSSKARAAPWWNAVGVAITAASQPAAASRSSAKAHPSRSASGRTRSASVSMITARSAPSASEMTRAWLAPIAPAPTSAIRARAPMAAVSAWRTAQIGNLQLRFDSAALSQQRDQQRGHHPSRDERAAEQSQLDAEEEGRAHGGDDEERDRPAGPPQGHPPVAGERDQDVAEDLGEDEPDAAGREQREVDIAQFESVADEDPGQGRTEKREPRDRDGTQADHEQQEAGQQRLKLLMPPPGGQRRELGQQRRLDRLEEKDRDIGDDAAELESSGGRLLLRGGEELDRDSADAEQHLGEHRCDEQEAERVGDLSPGGGRAGAKQSAPARRGENDRHKGRDDERDPVRAGCLDADDREDGCEGDPESAFATEQHAVRAEASVAGQRTPGQELEEIRGEPADQPCEQRRVALEDVLVERARSQERGNDQHHGQAPTEHGGADEDGRPSLPADPPGRDCPPGLLLERQEEPRSADEGP